MRNDHTETGEYLGPENEATDRLDGLPLDDLSGEISIEEQKAAGSYFAAGVEVVFDSHQEHAAYSAVMHQTVFGETQETADTLMVFLTKSGGDDIFYKADISDSTGLQHSYEVRADGLLWRSVRGVDSNDDSTPRPARFGRAVLRWLKDRVRQPVESKPSGDPVGLAEAELAVKIAQSAFP